MFEMKFRISVLNRIFLYYKKPRMLNLSFKAYSEIVVLIPLTRSINFHELKILFDVGWLRMRGDMAVVNFYPFLIQLHKYNVSKMCILLEMFLEKKIYIWYLYIM